MQVGLIAGMVAADWRLSTRNVVNLVWSQIYHTEHPPYLQHNRHDAAHVRGAGLSATADPYCRVAIVKLLVRNLHSYWSCIIVHVHTVSFTFIGR